jgi:hypothetical protein
MAIVLDGTTGLAGAATGALNGTLGATTPSTVVATTVVASSTIKGATTIAVGNATPSASGAGITFPATQSASTDANTLDDYEEGTWTPSLGGTATYVDRAGSYVKIGKFIYGQFQIAVNSIGTGSSTTISGLPFNSTATGDEGGAVTIRYFLNAATSRVFQCGSVTSNATTLSIQGMTAATTGITSAAFFTSGTYLFATFAYLTT